MLGELLRRWGPKERRGRENSSFEEVIFKLSSTGRIGGSLGDKKGRTENSGRRNNKREGESRWEGVWLMEANVAGAVAP